MYDSQTLGLNTKKFKGTTKEFFNQNTDMFDFIYVDASHKKADVASDLKESFKVLNIGGIIACDDYLWNADTPEIDRDLIPKDAIDEFINVNKDNIEILLDNYQLWFKKISQ
jgi:predicted O-methyltransferase YrrM